MFPGQGRALIALTNLRRPRFVFMVLVATAPPAQTRDLTRVDVLPAVRPWRTAAPGTSSR
jgi:hypothetical protein